MRPAGCQSIPTASMASRKMLRLRRELTLWQRMSHPSVIGLIQVMELQGVVVIACELAGEELFDRLQEVSAFKRRDNVERHRVCRLHLSEISVRVLSEHL